MDVALLGEVERERALFVVPCVLEIADDVPQERERRQDTNLLPTQLSISGVGS